MFQSRKFIFSVVCLAIFLYAGFGGRAFAASKEIRIGYIAADQLHSPAVMVMKEKKLLEAAGFTVMWREFLNGTYAMQDLAWDSIDFASCGVAPIMITHAQGVKLAVLAGSNAEGSSLVVTDSIKTIRDLHGKRIGTPGSGSTQDAMVAQLARANALQIKRRAMKISDMPLFLQKNEIDGFIAWAPHPARAVEDKLGHELLTSHDMMPGHQCCVLVTKESALRGDPETANIVLKVYLDAYKWFLDNQEESLQLLAKSTGMAEDIVRQALKTVVYPYPPYCNVASMQSMLRNLIETDKIAPIQEADLAFFTQDLCRLELLEKITGTTRPKL